MKRYTLSAIGRDRPGIVAAVTEVLYRHGFNIEDSTMTRLEDEFAIILITTAPEDRDIKSVREDFSRLQKETGLTIEVKELPAERGPEGEGANYIITLHGADRPGIVYRTAKLLAERGVNITDLETKSVASEEGTIYIMLMEAFVPPGVDESELKRELKKTGQELGVAVKIKPVEAFEPL